MIVPFPIATGTRVSAFGRDDAEVTGQNGQTVHVVCLDWFGRAFTAAIPLSRLKLARETDVALIDRWSNAKSVMHGSYDQLGEAES